MKSSSKPPPTPYKSPALPPPDALRARTASLRERNDALAAKLGLPSMAARTERSDFSPVPLSELAPAIKRQNEARAARTVEQEMAEAAAAEILHVCKAVASRNAEGALEGDDVAQFVEVVRELCNAILAQKPSVREGAKASMREAVNSLMRRMGLEGL